MYDDPHIYQTIGDVQYVTSHGGSRSERAIGGLFAHLLPIEPSGWWFMQRVNLHVGTDLIVPDIAGWRHARMPRFPVTDQLRLAPDWVAEIATVETALLARKEKLNAYAHHGVEWVWIIEPSQQTIDVFRLIDGRWFLIMTHGGDEAARIEPFKVIELPLATLWLPA